MHTRKLRLVLVAIAVAVLVAMPCIAQEKLAKGQAKRSPRKALSTACPS